MAGVRIISQAAREGCLAYLDTLDVLSADQRRQLRQQLMFASARTVADKFWDGYRAVLANPTALDRWELDLFGPRILAVCQALERLALDSAHFKQYYHPQAQAA